jgi:hypothetical protein
MKAKSVVVIDTSVLCIWLRIPGFETCGPDSNRWDYRRVEKEIEAAIECGYTLVLPLATVIESGNHIANSPTLRFETAGRLAGLITKAADQESPWAAFTDQTALWNPDNLKRLAVAWPELAARKLGIGDATIRDVFGYYSRMGFEVRLLTGDVELSSLKPLSPRLVPRRRLT